MIRHLFKLMWNKKKQNMLLIVEMLVSFLVMFAVFSSMVYFYRNYRKPMGMDYEHVWVVNYYNPTKFGSSDSLLQFYQTMRLSIKSLPSVKDLSYVGPNIPFSHYTNGGPYKYKGKAIDRTNVYEVEESYMDVLQCSVAEGRWIRKDDAIARNRRIVINEAFKLDVFGDEDPIGKLIDNMEGDQHYEVAGVIYDIKDKGDYTKPAPAIYKPADSSTYSWLNNMLIRMNPDADAAAESRLYKTIAGSMKSANVEIAHLSNMRKGINKFTLVPMIIALIVAGFLIVNVAFGLLGVLWYNINRRRAEIGLRRAIGATGKKVSQQLVTESMILATMALIIGIFFAAQFPLLNVFGLPATVYIIAMVLSVLFIYLLVLFCSLYPGSQAAAIYPAVALHED